jgi:hypothetical protein
MRTLMVVTTASLFFAGAVVGQEEFDGGVEAPEIIEAEDTGEGEGEVVYANDAEAERVSRLALASGGSEADILALREGGELAPSDEFEFGAPPPDATVTEGMGWGQVCHELGLHPGILGHGTGDKFMPELPEIDGDALGAVRTARERAMERKAERREARVLAQDSRRWAKAEKLRGASAGKGGKPDEVERGGKPENRGKSKNR